MSKAEIIAELPRLSPDERAEVQAKLDELAGGVWQDGGALSDADKQALDAALADYERFPDAGSPWDEVKARAGAAAAMTRRVITRLQAEVDITDAAVWYERQRPGLGLDFLAAVDLAVEKRADEDAARRTRDATFRNLREDGGSSLSL